MPGSNIRDKMKNPLLDVKEDISIKPFQRFSFFEKIGLNSALIISIVILILSGVSFYIDIFIKLNYLYILIDLSIIIVSLYALYYLLNAFKRTIITDRLIDTAFQEGVYARLQPLIENIAQTHVDTNIVLDRISSIDLKVQNILKERYARDISSGDFMQEPIAVGTSIKFAIKTVLLIMVTMAAFMFLLNFNLGGITPYAVLLVFIMWWGFITNEYHLWKETSAWAMVFFPILVVPVTVMLLGNLLNYNVLMATLYLSVGLYIFVYYLWAVYVTTGSLPFIIPQKKEHVTNEFFALQKKGILKEYLEAFIKRLELLQKNKENQESQYAWKK
jgi:hypothetical protein